METANTLIDLPMHWIVQLLAGVVDWPCVENCDPRRLCVFFCGGACDDPERSCSSAASASAGAWYLGAHYGHSLYVPL